MSLRLAAGQAAFAGDQSLPGMLHVALRRCESPHARVLSADASAARQLPGVAAVLTCEDAPRLLPRELLFAGERLAIAAAEEPELARRAAELVAFELEPLPARLDAWDQDESAVAARVAATEGDAERALGSAELVVSGEWRLPFVPAISLEPPLSLSWLDEDRRLVVRSSAESPFRVRASLAERLGVPAARIRVVRPATAGGSPGRSDLAVEDACALVTLTTGRPARLALSAGEALAIAPGRPAQRVRLRLGLARGEIVGLEATLLADLGMEGDGELLRSAARQALGLYRVPNLRFEAVAVRTNRPPAAAPRGSDEAFAFALECALDEAAASLGQDASALRRANLRRPGEAGAQALAALGEPDGGDDARPLAALLQQLDRGGRGSQARAFAARGRMADARRSGSGLAAARRADGASGQPAAAQIRLLEDGSFTLAAGPAAAGSPQERLYAEAAAAILEVPAERMVCAAPDTDSAPHVSGDGTPFGSAAGRAVEEAATRLRERIHEAGAALLGVRAAQARIAGGRVTANGGRGASFAEIGAAALRDGAPLAATAPPTQANVPHALAAAAAEVEVDVETGAVSVVSLRAVVAGGPFGDERHAAAQVEGALAAALELALAGGLGEPAPARAPHTWPAGLPVCTPSDVPPLEVAFVPGGEALSRFDTAAIAEAAARAATAAIANAVADATGQRLRTLPLDPARVLASLPEAQP